MLCIYHESTDPFFNVATDEYILKHLQEDCFMLWRNDNAIIVGQYQNTLAEINYDYVKEHNIAVVRRLSGGGAVYHDLGNLNFSFTETGKDSSLSDFEKFTKPIIDVIRELGVDAKFEGKNDDREYRGERLDAGLFQPNRMDRQARTLFRGGWSCPQKTGHA